MTNMSVSLRRNVALHTSSRSGRVSRKPLIARAFLNDIGAGFSQIFSPLSRGKLQDRSAIGTRYTGKVKPHTEPRKPFRDGWNARPQKIAAVHKDPSTEPTGEDALAFINKAAESVVAHNFTGDVTEPTAWNSSGWKADIHTRKRDGFHGVKSGYPAGKPKPKEAVMAALALEDATASKAEKTGDTEDALEFISKAAESVVAHNFSGDSTEPESWKGEGDKISRGWQGDIHGRKREGFHSITD